MKTKTIIIALLAIVYTIVSFAQTTQTESFPHRKLGLGIRVAGIQIAEIQSNAIPATRMILNIDAHKYFRIEGQLGVYSRTSEELRTSGTTKVTVKQKTESQYYSIGLMGLYPVERTRFVGGVRYGFNNYSSDEGGYSTPIKNTGKITIFSGVIGGEYFFAKAFSIGAEFAVSATKDDLTVSPSTYSNGGTYKSILTEGNLIFRFYPF